MKNHKMKPNILPKLKFKMLNRQLMNSDLPLDLTIDKTNQIKSTQLFRPYIDCNSSPLKSNQMNYSFLPNESLIDELMIKNLFNPFSSPFIYKFSPSFNLSTQSHYPSLQSYDQMIKQSTPHYLNPIQSPSERSSSYSPTSIISNITTLSSANSSTSVDFNYRPLEILDQEPIDLSKSAKCELNVKPRRIRQIKQNQKLMKNSTNQNQILIKCPYCWQLFDQENSLRKHIKSKHQMNDGSSTFDRIHKCEHCVLAFTRFDMLQRHNRKHTGEKPYECNMCFQNFSRSDHLNTHRINHFGLKMYKCSKCAYASSRRDMVSRHLQTHSNESDSNAYVKTDLSVKQLCKKLVHSTPDQIPELLGRFRLEC